MAIRNRIKKKLQSFLGLEATSPPHKTSTSSSQPNQEVQPAASTQASQPIQQPSIQQSSSIKDTAQVQVQNEVLTEEQQKIQKHLHRTRMGLLKFLDKNGGILGLAELHDHSEKRYFVGHKKFSDLLEDLVAEELISYDWSAQQATLTEKGRESLK